MRNYTPPAVFYFTKMERNAALVLTAFCLLSFTAPVFYPASNSATEKTDFSTIRQYAQQLRPVEKPKANYDRWQKPQFRGGDDMDEHPIAARQFAFDPNTATKDDFVALGLSPKLAQTILNYRSKGGQFRKAEDFKKLYGLREEDYQRLLPWIQIAAKEHPAPQAQQGSPNFVSQEERAYKHEAPLLLDINTATVEDWDQLRGIGASYAQRIVNFREKLGGFTSVEQVAETRGLPDSTFQKILPHLQASPVLRKIRINTASLDELKAHPYLSSYAATVIFNYRTQHGRFAGMADLGKIVALKKTDLTKLEGYLDFE
jgi:competence protein ComEA